MEYKITPVYASDRLVSIFGELDYYAGLPHGSTRYYGYNYWKDPLQTYLNLDSAVEDDKSTQSFEPEPPLMRGRLHLLGMSAPHQSDSDSNLESLYHFELPNIGLTNL